jgi:hypothetical protein
MIASLAASQTSGKKITDNIKRSLKGPVKEIFFFYSLAMMIRPDSGI